MKSFVHIVEVEVTAKLTKKEYSSLEKYLEKNFTKVSSQKRYMVKFHKKEKINLNDEVDIRYKWTNGIHQLVIKKGAMGSKSRQEITIDLANKNQVEHFGKLFSLLGYKLANNVYRELERYENKNLEVTLAKTPGGYLFAEIESLGAKTTQSALKNIHNFCQEVGITPFSKDEYHSYINILDKKVNYQLPIKDFPQALLRKKDWKKILEETVFSS